MHLTLQMTLVTSCISLGNHPKLLAILLLVHSEYRCAAIAVSARNLKAQDHRSVSKLHSDEVNKETQCMSIFLYSAFDDDSLSWFINALSLLFAGKGIICVTNESYGPASFARSQTKHAWPCEKRHEYTLKTHVLVDSTVGAVSCRYPAAGFSCRAQ